MKVAYAQALLRSLRIVSVLYTLYERLRALRQDVQKFVHLD
jgi:hypothetical protein